MIFHGDTVCIWWASIRNSAESSALISSDFPTECLFLCCHFNKLCLICSCRSLGFWCTIEMISISERPSFLANFRHLLPRWVVMMSNSVPSSEILKDTWLYNDDSCAQNNPGSQLLSVIFRYTVPTAREKLFSRTFLGQSIQDLKDPENYFVIFHVSRTCTWESCDILT